MFGDSCGAFWTKIGGNQAETIPKLPIYPRALNSYRKTQKIARENLRKKRKNQKKKASRLLAVERIVLSLFVRSSLSANRPAVILGPRELNTEARQDRGPVLERPKRSLV